MISPDDALQFAVMLQAGMPSGDAISYFVQGDPREVAEFHAEMMKSRALKDALRKLQRRPWHEMGLEERIDNALNLHYSGLAYLLYSINYGEASPSDKSKLDTARQALEAKKAGMAGKTDALTRFMDDFVAGKLRDKIPSPIIPKVEH